MLTIQDAGKQILNGNPGKFYIFGGPEYGIKEKYIEHLKSFYQGQFTEAENFQSIMELMRIKQLIPLRRQLYIVRYDEDFLSSLSNSTFSYILSTNIVGTIVLLYHQEKATAKCDKYLSQYTISFDLVAPQFVQKYLITDFPDLAVQHIKFAIGFRSDYKGAYNICKLLSSANEESVARYDTSDLEYLLYCNSDSLEAQIKLGVAAKDFKYLTKMLEDYPGDLNTVLYAMLNTMVEIDKLQSKGYIDSPLKPYVNLWSGADVYNMYMITFEVLQNSRNATTHIYNQIIYLFAILQYRQIPANIAAY